MRTLKRSLLALPFLLLAFGMAAGCHSTVPSLLLTIEDPTGLAPTQVRITVSVEELETHRVTRPEVPQEPLASPQTLRLFMPDEAVGRRVDLTVEALRDGVVVGSAVTVTVLKAVEDTLLEMALVPSTAPGVCDATTCPFGCCDGNVCIEGDVEACGAGGGACKACDNTSSDACIEGACRCGADAPCPAGYRCEGGACAPSGEGQSCTVHEQCNAPPGQCFEAQGTCGEDGKCAYAPRASTDACDDGNSCTDGDHCDGAGTCVATPRVCDGPTGQCLEDVGTCVNGTCRYDGLPTSTPCDDNNACTDPDRCDGSGTCKGSPKSCQRPPNAQCWEPDGTCEGGSCSYTRKQTGTPCGTGDACTAYTCNASGQCVSSAKVTCNNPPSPCHKATGTCNPSTGACTYEVDVGAPCQDTDACTSNTTCQPNGTCGGGTQKVCNTPPDPCRKATGTCNPSTGACSYAVDTGKSCTDDDYCSVNTTCQSNGTCGGGTTRACTTPPDNNGCWQPVGTCSSGSCQYQPKSSGTACGVNNDCQSSACNGSGQCISTHINQGEFCGMGCGTCSNGVCGGTCPSGFHCCGDYCEQNGRECR